MTRVFLCGAATLALLAAAPAVAQDKSKSIDPVELSKQVKGPPAQLSDQQRDAIQDALVGEHTQQKTPANFQPQVGQTLPQSLKVDAMPQDLIRAQPSLKEYGYAKTAKDILVLDPLHKKIVAVLPRKFPNDPKANAKSSSDWADTKGRELTGQAPKGAQNNDHFPEPAGDAGDIKNGNDKSAQEKEDGSGKQ